MVEKGILTGFSFRESFITPLFIINTPVLLAEMNLRIDDAEDRVWLNGMVNWAVVAPEAAGTVDLLFEILRENTLIYSIAQSASYYPGGVLLLNAQLQHVDDNPLAGGGVIPAPVRYQLRVTPLSVPSGVQVATVSQAFVASELKATEL